MFFLGILYAACCLVSSLSCYKCFSINGSNPSCEDLFHGDIAGRTSFLQTPCVTSLRKRNGTFPATHCIKLVAYSNGNVKFDDFDVKITNSLSSA